MARRSVDFIRKRAEPLGFIEAPWVIISVSALGFALIGLALVLLVGMTP